jgi:hypothetical protein
MSTITAVASDGISLIHLEGTGEGTLQSPFRPKHTLPDGAATAAGQNDIIAQLTDLNEALGATLTVDTTLEPLTNAELRATPVPVTGTVTLDSSSLTALENITVTVGAAVEINNDVGNPIPASVATLPLPNGAATAANQATIIGYVDGIETLLGGTLTVSTGLTPLTDAQLRATAVPVSVAALPLPSGAATAANQATIIGHIDGIEALLGGTLTVNTGLTPLTDAQLRATAVPVSLASLPTVTLAAESGYLLYRNTSLTNTASSVKASAGSVKGLNIINSNTVPVYIKFYNTVAGSVTVGTTSITAVRFVPAANANGPGVYHLDNSRVPAIVFSQAVSVAAVTGLADNDTTAPAVPVYIEITYD